VHGVGEHFANITRTLRSCTRSRSASNSSRSV
jgi:hypothetical protein